MSQVQDQSTSETGWIKWFCNLEDHHYFSEVDEFFIADQFNLYGLKQQFDHFEEALQMILSQNTPSEEDLQDEQFLEIYSQGSELFGLIHARFILTPQGLTLMKSKYLQGRFGVCPRVLCERQNVLPIGLSEELRTSRVKIYCPRCQDVYTPKKRMNDVDGSFFGCSFPHIFLSVILYEQKNLVIKQTFQELEPSKNVQSYIPRVYGFRLHQRKGSKYLQLEQKQEIYYYGDEHVKRLSLQNQEVNTADLEDNVDQKGKQKLPQNILSELNDPPQKQITQEIIKLPQQKQQSQKPSQKKK